MTLSFKELVEQPAGSLVYISRGGESITFSEHLAEQGEISDRFGAHVANPKVVDRIYDRERFQRHFPGWSLENLPVRDSVLYHKALWTKPTIPYALLLNKMHLSISTYVGIESYAYVEALIGGNIAYIPLQVFDFFSNLRVKETLGKRPLTENESLMADMQDFARFQTARIRFCK